MKVNSGLSDFFSKQANNDIWIFTRLFAAKHLQSISCHWNELNGPSHTNKHVSEEAVRRCSSK